MLLKDIKFKMFKCLCFNLNTLIRPIQLCLKIISKVNSFGYMESPLYLLYLDFLRFYAYFYGPCCFFVHCETAKWNKFHIYLTRLEIGKQVLNFLFGRAYETSFIRCLYGLLRNVFAFKSYSQINI